MNDSLVSIIVPFYNTPREQFERCIGSLVRQTYTDIEIIAIDDGSSPECVDYFDEVCNTDTRLVPLHKCNEGVSSARNLGIKEAKGNFLCFVDSDDWVDDGFVETLLSLMQSTGSQIACCNWIAETAVGSKPAIHPSQEVKTFNQEEAYHHILYSTEIQGFLWNKIFFKNLITQGLNERYHICEDFVFTAHYLQGVKKMAFSAAGMYHYRQVGKGVTAVKTLSPKFYSQLYAYQEIEQIYGNLKHPDCMAIRLNVLKIALNHRARMVLFHIKDNNYLEKIKEVIRCYMPAVIKSREITLSEKTNCLLTWCFPATMLRIKSKILGC